MSHFPIAVLVPKILRNNADGIAKIIEQNSGEFVGVIVDCHI